jgi:hypothetical protein
VVELRFFVSRNVILHKIMVWFVFVVVDTNHLHCGRITFLASWNVIFHKIMAWFVFVVVDTNHLHCGRITFLRQSECNLAQNSERTYRKFLTNIYKVTLSLQSNSGLNSAYLNL